MLLFWKLFTKKFGVLLIVWNKNLLQTEKIKIMKMFSIYLFIIYIYPASSTTRKMQQKIHLFFLLNWLPCQDKRKPVYNAIYS